MTFVAFFFVCRRFSFVKLNEMEGLEANKILDVIGVVKGYDDFAIINTKCVVSAHLICCIHTSSGPVTSGRMRLRPSTREHHL